MTKIVKLAPTVVAAAAALAACGGSSSGSSSASGGTTPASPTSAVAAAFSKTTGAGTARMTLDLSVGLGSSGQAIKAHGSGLLDFTNSSAQLTETVANQTLQMRDVGKVLYLHGTAAEDRALGTTKPWLKVDLSKLAAGQSLGSGVTGDSGQQFLGMLRGAATSVKKTGTVTVAGVKTTQYTAKVSVSKLLGTAGIAGTQAKTLEGHGLAKTLPITVDIDPQGRTRKMTFSLHAGPATVSMAMVLTDFGVPVHVTAPPAGQTADVTGKIAKLQSSQGASSTSSA